MEEGGETAFPHGRWLDEEAQAAPPYSECASKGVAVKPRKGDAILFFSLKPGGALWGVRVWVDVWCGCAL